MIKNPQSQRTNIKTLNLTDKLALAGADSNTYPSYTADKSLSYLLAQINSTTASDWPFLWVFQTTKNQTTSYNRDCISIWSHKTPDSGQTPYGDFIGLDMWAINDFDDDSYKHDPYDASKYNCVSALDLMAETRQQWGSALCVELGAKHNDDGGHSPSGALTALNLNVRPRRAAAAAEAGKTNAHSILRVYNFSDNSTDVDTGISVWGGSARKIKRFIAKDQCSHLSAPYVDYFADLKDWNIATVGIDFSNATIVSDIAIKFSGGHITNTGDHHIKDLYIPNAQFIYWKNNAGTYKKMLDMNASDDLTVGAELGAGHLFINADGSVKKVEYGAVDSGGAGFKMVRVAN